MDFQTLTPLDKYNIAVDTLRGRESDYFRLSLLDPQTIGGPERLTAMENEIAHLREEVASLEAAIQAEAPADPQPVQAFSVNDTPPHEEAPEPDLGTGDAEQHEEEV